MNCLFCFFVSCLGGSPSATDILPSPREVRAGGKTFFFDVERNDRGVFVRLSEVSSPAGILCMWLISRKALATASMETFVGVIPYLGKFSDLKFSNNH